MSNSNTREVISTGNDLAAMAAVDAGCRFFGGYPKLLLQVR